MKIRNTILNEMFDVFNDQFFEGSLRKVPVFQLKPNTKLGYFKIPENCKGLHICNYHDVGGYKNVCLTEKILVKKFGACNTGSALIHEMIHQKFNDCTQTPKPGHHVAFIKECRRIMVESDFMFGPIGYHITDHDLLHVSARKLSHRIKKELQKGA